MIQNNQLRAHSALVLAMLIWGSTFMAMKVVITDIAPMVVIFLRMIIGSMVFILVWRWIRHNIEYRQGDWKYLAVMALFEPCLYFIFEGLALKYTSAGQAGMVTAMLPLMVAVGAFIFLKERISKRQSAGFLLAMAGVVWMTLGSVQNEHASNSLLGNFLEFMAMVCAMGYTLMMKHLTERYPAIFLTAIQSFIGAFFFLPLALGSEWPASISIEQWGILLYLGVIVTIGGYGLFNYSLTYVKATVAVAYINLLPAISLIYAMVFLGERMNLEQWIAVAVIFSGVYLSRGGAPEAVSEEQDNADKVKDDVNPAVG